jgi:hypothetical protein
LLVERQLDKAEALEKHALEVMTKMPKPSQPTDAQFAELKSQKTIQAHSGLGFIYFRHQDSVTKLQQAVRNNPRPDPTDRYVLGIDLQNLNRKAEAGEIFYRCAAMLSTLQDRCKESADAIEKLANQ